MKTKNKVLITLICSVFMVIGMLQPVHAGLGGGGNHIDLIKVVHVTNAAKEDDKITLSQDVNLNFEIVPLTETAKLENQLPPEKFTKDKEYFEAQIHNNYHHKIKSEHGNLPQDKINDLADIEVKNDTELQKFLQTKKMIIHPGNVECFNKKGFKIDIPKGEYPLNDSKFTVKKESFDTLVKSLIDKQNTNFENVDSGYYAYQIKEISTNEDAIGFYPRVDKGQDDNMYLLACVVKYDDTYELEIDMYYKNKRLDYLITDGDHVEVHNNYDQKRPLTIKKVCTDDPSAEFDITVKVDKGELQKYKLKNGGAINLEPIPVTSKVTITETTPKGFTTTRNIDGTVDLSHNIDYEKVEGNKITLDGIRRIDMVITSTSKKTKSDSTPSIYRVEFDTDGGSAIDTQYLEFGDKVVKPLDPVKEGYEFDGWYIKKDILEDLHRIYPPRSQEDLVAFDFNTRITKDITLVAKWKEVKKPVVVPEEKEEPTLPGVGDSNHIWMWSIVCMTAFVCSKKFYKQLKHSA